MSEQRFSYDPGSLWRSQSGEEVEVDVREFVHRRGRQLYSATQTEVKISVAAALFFAAVIAWRFSLRQNLLLGIGVALILGWVVAVVLRFRAQLRRSAKPSGSTLAMPCVQYYRRQLEQRRDHLRNAWLWHGPLVLACVVAAGIVAGSSFYSYQRIRSISPLLIVLAIWTALMWTRRRRQASDIQREIDEVKLLGTGGGGF
jgi:hypothetical protein